MPTVAAPRIDDRLRRFIAGSAELETPAAITRAVGELAWQLDLPRPSYQQVRVIVRAAEPRPDGLPAAPPSFVATAARAATRTIDFLYQYPAPGLGNWYRRYVRGGA